VNIIETNNYGENQNHWLFYDKFKYPPFSFSEITLSLHNIKHRPLIGLEWPVSRW